MSWVLSDQLDAGHRGVVPRAGSDLEDAGVATRAVGVAGTDLLEELGDHLLVAQERHHLAVVVESALLGLGGLALILRRRR